MSNASLYSSKTHPRRVFPIQDWINGQSDYNKIGGSYLWARGIDYRTEPSQLTLLPAGVLEAGQSTVSDLIKWGEQVVGRTVTLGSTINLISNNSFETNTTGWTLGADFTRSNTKAYIGSYAIKQVSTTGTASITTASGSGIAVSQYTDYQLTFYAYITITSGSQPVLQVLGNSLSGTNLLPATVGLADTAGAWVAITNTFNSGANTSVFISIANAGGALTAYYDSFSINQINSLATFALGNQGTLYKRYSSGDWVTLGTIPNSHGNGLAYYGEDDFVYVAGDKTLGRYGPISSGTPTLVSDYLASAGGVPTNTNSVAFISANSDYAVKTSPSSVLKITGDLALEAFINPSSLPTAGNSMTIMGLWNETANQRAYKLDLFGVSGYFGTGADGSLTISVNSTNNPIDSQCSGTIGTNSLYASNASFAVGQRILIVQMQGSGASAKQLTTIQGYDNTNGIITTQDQLKISYNSSGSNRAQVLALPQYTSVTVNNGITWTTKTWNGSTGGILAFICSGTFTNNGTITADGQGFRGASAVSNDSDGLQGEGYATTSYNSTSNSANGNGGGGGQDGQIHAGTYNFGGGGGGGGGNGSTGSSGVAPNPNALGGVGGNGGGTSDLSSVVLGGGGGSGGHHNSGSAGNGNSGGGFFYAIANNTVVTGSITANGLAGGSASGGDGGGGGGGAGGNILIQTQTATLGSGLLTANGGSGGGIAGSGGAGGNGDMGRITIDYLVSYSGSSSPTLTAIQDNTLVTTTTIQARLGLSNDGTSFEYLTQNLQNIAISAWDRIQVSWSASTSTASFLEGGVPIGTSTGTKTSIYGSSTADFAIGANVTTVYSNFFNGLVNDARAWNTQRTQSQFAANNLVNLGGIAPGLVGNWFVNNSANDQTANANNLVLTGSPTPLYGTNVPFAGATTRLDIDQTGGGTGQTYTLPTSIAEAQRQSFVPALDPQKSLQVNINAKGTGDWTLVVHNGLNQQVAIATVVNALLPTSGTYEFVFPTVYSPVVGATYHFHIYSTVADGSIKTTAASDMTTAQFTTYYQFLMNDTEYHPMMQMVNVLSIGNGRYLAVQDAAAGYNSRRLKFPSGWRVRCFAVWNGYYAIGMWRGTNIKDFDQGMVFLWDGYSVTYNDYFYVPEGGVNAMYGENDTLYIVAGYKGDLLEYTGGKRAKKVKRLPRVGKTNYIEVTPGGMTFWQGLLRISVGYNSDSATFERGIYTWGTLNEAYPKSLSYDYPISTGNRFTTVSTGALIPVGGNLLSCFKDNVSYGVDNINVSNPCQTSGTLEELVTDLGFYWKSKEALTVRADHLALKTGENVDVKYKVNYESTWHNLGITSQKVGDTFTRLPLPTPLAQYHSLQIATDLYATNGTSPTILEHSQDTDLLLTATDENAS